MLGFAEGITPAGAGKTNHQLPQNYIRQDHPRRCGENPVAINMVNSRFGITPAGAGKTLSDVDRDGNKKDHPRRCGENFSPGTTGFRECGSPPQVRGKPGLRLLVPSSTRITPAGAGKTIGEHCEARKTRDHPRRCGENPPSGLIRYTHAGSPPQVRGKLMYFVLADIPKRITPAGAGKTGVWSGLCTGRQDHPRRCGEN